MKFNVSDETDSALCVALQHEFLRCHDAFTELCTLGPISLSVGNDPWIAYRMYNAYSRFIHHLYEFLIGLMSREKGNTAQIRWEDSDPWLNLQIQCILTRKRAAIKDGTAPSYENDIDYYPEKVPKQFAKEFREYRNKVSGHVSHKRSSLSMTDFYDRNHKFLHMLYADGLYWWGLRSNTFPDLDEITEFSIRIGETLAGPKK